MNLTCITTGTSVSNTASLLNGGVAGGEYTIGFVPNTSTSNA
ncbi:MAG TPA: hypothetical protein VFM97_10650 [Gammaproteobacteria bacterium]|nr:hypothetical protein [Gammaproteobacteria bacterium]